MTGAKRGASRVTDASANTSANADANTHTIAVTDYDFPDLSIEADVLAGDEFELIAVETDSPADVIEAVPEADGLLVQYARITEDVFDELENLRAVGRYGIGVDSVDLEAATTHDVQVCNVPSYCEEEVSIHALSLTLDCIRRVSLYDRRIKSGEWDWTAGKPIHRVGGRTVGFAGFGKIPARLTSLLEGFDLEFVAYDPYLDADELAEHGVEKVDFEELLARSNVISIHAPLTEETAGMFDADAFSSMREDAFVVNTARGGLIDVDALERALEANELAGAGLDVVPEEPPEDFSLLEREDVVATPHVAWYSEESMDEMRRTVTADVAGVVRGEDPVNPVNEIGGE